MGGSTLAPSKTRQLSEWALGVLGLDRSKLEAIMALRCEAPVIKNNSVR